MVKIFLQFYTTNLHPIFAKIFGLLFPFVAFLLHWPRWWNPLWWSLPLQCHFVPGTIFRWPRLGVGSRTKLGAATTILLVQHTYTRTHTHTQSPSGLALGKNGSSCSVEYPDSSRRKSSHSRGVFSTRFFLLFSPKRTQDGETLPDTHTERSDTARGMWPRNGANRRRRQRRRVRAS